MRRYTVYCLNEEGYRMILGDIYAYSEWMALEIAMEEYEDSTVFVVPYEE